MKKTSYYNLNEKDKKHSKDNKSNKKAPSGHSYTIITDNDKKRNVLLGKKNKKSRWRDRDTSQGYTITNNPSQYVFPGGGIEGDFNPNSAINAAIREFGEETGLKIMLDSQNPIRGSIVREYQGSSQGMAPLASIMGGGILRGVKKKPSDPEPQYAGLHLIAQPHQSFADKPSPAVLEFLSRNFDEMRANDDKIYNASLKNKSGKLKNLSIPEDEMEKLFSAPHSQALGLIKGSHRNLSGLKTEWLSELLQQIKENGP